MTGDLFSWCTPRIDMCCSGNPIYSTFLSPFIAKIDLYAFFVFKWTKLSCALTMSFTNIISGKRKVGGGEGIPSWNCITLQCIHCCFLSQTFNFNRENQLLSFPLFSYISLFYLVTLQKFYFTFRFRGWLSCLWVHNRTFLPICVFQRFESHSKQKESNAGCPVKVNN